MTMIADATQLGIAGMEFGNFSGNWDNYESLPDFAKKNGLNLLVHNYFPVPSSDQFVLNLADPDDNIYRKSYEFVINSLHWCAKHGIKIYSVHSGFACTPSVDMLGKSIVAALPCDMDYALDRFHSALYKLCSLADSLGVNIAIENNVCPPSNAPEGVNRHSLCVTPDEILSTFQILANTSCKLLLDLGHLKVSAQTLNFDIFHAIDVLIENVAAVHLHDNNGVCDEHNLPILPNQMLTYLLNLLHSEIPIILEVRPQPVSSLAKWLETGEISK